MNKTPCFTVVSPTKNSRARFKNWDLRSEIFNIHVSSELFQYQPASTHQSFLGPMFAPNSNYPSGYKKSNQKDESITNPFGSMASPAHNSNQVRSFSVRNKRSSFQTSTIGIDRDPVANYSISGFEGPSDTTKIATSSNKKRRETSICKVACGKFFSLFIDRS